MQWDPITLWPSDEPGFDVLPTSCFRTSTHPPCPKPTSSEKHVLQVSPWVMLWSQTPLSQVSTVAIPKSFGIVTESPVISILEVWPSTQAIGFFIFLLKVSASFMEMTGLSASRNPAGKWFISGFLEPNDHHFHHVSSCSFLTNTLFIQDTPGLSAWAPSQEIKKECGG